MKRHTLGLSLLIAALAFLGWLVFRDTWTGRHQHPENAHLLTSASLPDPLASTEPIQALATPILDSRKVALGKALFHDPRLSVDNTVACSACHEAQRGGADGRVVSVGVGGQNGSLNAPSVNYASLNFRQFWDGRAPTLEAQIDGPIHHPAEMGSNWDQILGKLRQDAPFSARFRMAYPAGFSPETIRDAIAQFERSLSLPSRFDRWLEGEMEALTQEEIAGYKVFKHHGCTACHQGRGIGGNMFQKFGIANNPMERKARLNSADLGRFNVTSRLEDRYVFKVPSLRNVGLTAPYFHDGSATTLEEAVAIMGHAQLGLQLSSKEVTQISRFLRSLTAMEPARD